MPLKLTKKPNPKAPEYTRVYLKLVALEFDVRDILGNRVKSGMSPQQLEHHGQATSRRFVTLCLYPDNCSDDSYYSILLHIFKSMLKIAELPSLVSESNRRL